MTNPNWAEQVTAIATKVGEINDIIGVVVPAVDQARTQLSDVQLRLQGVQERIDRILTFAGQSLKGLARERMQ